jgi:hypothetical protein
MNTLFKSISFSFALAVAAVLAASTQSSPAQSASATISDVAAGGGLFDYTILLQNTGTANLNSFWYGWTQSGNNLPSNPSNAGNSLGWANTLSGNSIMWQNSTGTALAHNQTATFTFQSTSTLAAMIAPPSGESVAYEGTIDFSQNSPGDSTAIFSPTVAAAPEPSTIGLLVTAIPLLAASYRRFGHVKN